MPKFLTPGAEDTKLLEAIKGAKYEAVELTNGEAIKMAEGVSLMINGGSELGDEIINLTVLAAAERREYWLVIKIAPS